MRELTSAYTHSRKADEAFPEPRTGTTFSLHLRIPRHRFRLPSSSALSGLLLTSAHTCTSTLERYDSRRGTSVEHRLATTSCPIKDAYWTVKLTMTSLVLASDGSLPSTKATLIRAAWSIHVETRSALRERRLFIGKERSVLVDPHHGEDLLKVRA
jgi:hypothetical protein